MAVDAGHLTIPGNYGEIPLAGRDAGAELLKDVGDVTKIQQDQALTKDTQAATQLRQAQVPGEVAKSSLATMDVNDTQIARVMRGVDWSDPDAASNADAGLQKLVDAGNADAQQYIGKLSPATTERLADSLEGGRVRQASSASEQLAAGDQQTGAGSPAQLRQQLAQIAPDQLAAAYQQATDYDASLQRIYHAANPAKQWDIEAQAHAPQLVGRYSPLRLGQMLKETETTLPIMGSILSERGIGLPGAQPATEYKEAGGSLYAINPYAPDGQQVKAVGGVETLVGTDSSGRAVYHGAQGEDVGTHVLGAKPGTNRDTVFQQKQDAWLAVHPGDAQGALGYASGRGGTMTGPQIQTAAASQAAKDLQALSAASSPPADPNAYLAQQTALHASEISAAAPSPGGGAGGATVDPNAPPPAPQDDYTGPRENYAYAVSSLQQQIAAAKPGTPNYAQLQKNLAKAQSDAAQHLPPVPNGGTLPPRALVALKQAGEGVPHAFVNGTGWMMKNGQAVRLW